MRKIYGRGLNFAAQLTHTRQNIPEFTQIEDLKQYKVKSLGCGILQSYYLLSDNQFLKTGYFLDTLTNNRIFNLYRLASNLFTKFQKLFFLPKLLRFKEGDENLVLMNKPQVIIGLQFAKVIYSHATVFLITDAGEIFATGENYSGQLGTGNDAPIDGKFAKINSIPDKVKDIACGFKHTVFLTQSGKLYGSGACHQYQIQDQKHQTDKSPTVFERHLDPALIWDKTPIQKIACGLKSTLFLTKYGKLYALGSNKFGQNGINHHKYDSFPCPRQVFLPFDEQIIEICCGFWHTLILTSKDVYFAGSLEQNQNPFSKFKETICTFTAMNLPCKPVKIFTQFDRSAIVLQNGQLYLFGGRDFSNCGGQSGKLQIIKNYNFNKNSLVGLGFGHTLLAP